jgi:hypothetical protein
MPYVTVRLRLGGREQDVQALLDSGSSVNVLPYDVGVRLGADWNALTVPLPLTGSLGAHPAKALALDLIVPPFAAVQMIFAWSRSPQAPVLLGELGFFDAFDVRFCRSRGFIEIGPRP